MEEWEDAVDASDDEHQEIARINSIVQKTRSEHGEEDTNDKRLIAVPERVRRVSYRLKPQKPSETSSPSDTRDEYIRATLENKPEVDLSPLYASGSDKEIEERAYRILFPLLRKSVAMFKKHSHFDAFGDLKIACAVCTELTQVQGWEALLLHTKEYWKSYPYQHKGYYRALTDAFEAEKFWPKPADPVIWPPVLLVDNSGANFNGSLRDSRSVNGEQHPHTLKDLQVEEIIAVYKKAGQDDGCVLVFPGSEIGRVDASALNKVLETGGSAEKRSSSIRLPSGDKTVPNGGLEKFMNLRLSNGENLRRKSTIATLKKVAEEEEKVNNDESDQSTCSSESKNEYADNHPLANRDPTKQTKNMGRAVKLIDKLGGTFQGSEDLCAFPYSHPFRKSKMLQEMDAKFQEDLKSVGLKGAAVNPEIRARLEKIDAQLCKEKLQWLKEIDRIREPLERTRKTESQVHTGLEKQVHMIRMGKTKFARCEKLEEQVKMHQRHLKHINFKKKKQLMKASQNRCDALLAAWQLKKEAFGRQAEIVRLGRDILTTHYKNDQRKAQFIRRIYDGINAESETESDNDLSDKEKSELVTLPENSESLRKSDKIGKTENLKRPEKARRSSVKLHPCC